MTSLNRVTLIGNLGTDPEVRYMTNGDAVANISVATTETWKDKNGERQEKTEWHRVTFYRKIAEIVGQYLKKGSQVYIEGKLVTRKWEDKKTGEEKYTTEIIANEMKMLGGKRGGGSDHQPVESLHASQWAKDQEESLPMSQRGLSNKGSGAVPAGGGFDDMDDDIPF